MAIFTNQATLTYNDTITNSNITTGELVEVLSATKTAVTDTYASGDDITYVVSIVNTGILPFTGLTVTDDLGAYTVGDNTVYPLRYVAGSVRYYVNGVLQAAPTVTTTEPLTISGISVPAGGNAILIYEADVTGFAPPTEDGTVVNTATVQGGGLSTPLTATETVRTTNEPVLTISKSLSPTTVTENGQLTYTFVIQNSGNTPAVATDNVAVTDLFDPILSDLTVTFNGTLWSEPANYTYNESTGLFTTVPGQITVPAATFTQDPDTGLWVTTPGVAVLTVVGTI